MGTLLALMLGVNFVSDYKCYYEEMPPKLIKAIERHENRCAKRKIAPAACTKPKWLERKLVPYCAFTTK